MWYRYTRYDTVVYGVVLSYNNKKTTWYSVWTTYYRTLREQEDKIHSCIPVHIWYMVQQQRCSIPVIYTIIYVRVRIPYRKKGRKQRIYCIFLCHSLLSWCCEAYIYSRGIWLKAYRTVSHFLLLFMFVCPVLIFQ